MAGFNPFKKFRVYQRYALALLGIMAIISFIILPTLLMNFDGRSGPVSSLIATCRRPGYGNVDYNRIGILQQNRNTLRSFYDVLYGTLAQQVSQSDQMRLFPLYRLAASYSGAISETALIENWLLARYAHDKGFVITDKLVTDFLSSITDKTINNASLQLVCEAIGVSESQMLYVLKEELLTAHIRNVFLQSTVPSTPVARWDYYQRIRRSLTAEVAAVPVEEFANSVAAPSNMELEAFFQANKNRVYDPSLPESGFLVPRKIAFEVIDTTPSEELLDSITQEEIEQFYEENKETFFRNSSALPSPMGGQRPDVLGPGLPGVNQGTSIFPNFQLDNPSGDFQSDYLNSPTELPGPGLNLPNEPTNELPQSQPQSEPEATPETNEQTRTDNTGVYRNVVFQQEGEEPDAPAPVEEPQTEESDAPAPVEEPQTEESDAPAPPVEEPKTEESDAPAPPVEEPKTDVDELQPTEATPSEGEQETESSDVDTSVLYQPLSNVENLIRQLLANQKVDDSVTEISKQMREYFTSSYISNSTIVKPNLAALAAQHNLQLISVTTPISIYEAQTKDFWQINPVQAFLGRIFSDNPPIYEPIVGRDDMKNMQQQDISALAYIGWITSSSSQMTPQFTDDGVKEIVKKRWIEVHARQFALDKAKEYAELANKSKDQSLHESLAHANLKLVNTERFSWFTQSYAAAGYSQASIEFGEVCEQGVPKGNANFGNKVILAPGQSFMETAYSLQVGETGVAFNQPEMIAYVIRVTESNPTDDLLWRFFAIASPNDYMGAGKNDAQREQYMAWIKQIEKSVGFEWVNRPDENRMED